ncbi:MAG: OmpH family outer membrane protein [Candidatus Gastranaerophilales bacterium]|nr:OmpH family outer membrane protein [Candidatus Gastranaerophilales bacterium]
MKSIKNMLALFILVVVFFAYGNGAQATEVGVVNLEKIINDYAKAQDLAAELRVKDAELQKFVVEAQRKLKNTTSPVERKNLEEKLAAEYKNKGLKIQEYRDTEWNDIETNIINTINQVATAKSYNLVLNKSSVVVGGEDITIEVLKILNSKK